ncbi:MAG TPA: ATP-dependent sacrificial sulfur transferase LarE [Cyclobacteriaceae bacterium]|nr:ATP-dependent sacrificial sulfur transferase LarE [Cyclobacteriaceae bacterium]
MHDRVTSYQEEAEMKLGALQREISKYDSLIIAYSGGLDSSLLLKAATMVLGEKSMAVISDSPSIPRSELNLALQFATDIKARIRIIKTDEVDNKNYAANPANRCYFCKTELYEVLQRVAEEEGMRYIANGTNLDDLGDYRPGLRAADEHTVVSPLKDAGLTKNDIRMIAKHLNLNVWDKPASPCLASRIPYGSEVTREKLTQVEQAEEYIKNLGIRELRVRHFGPKAVIEVNPLDKRIIEFHLSNIHTRFTQLGFLTIEIKEFQSGSLNKLINIDAKG